MELESLSSQTECNRATTSRSYEKRRPFASGNINQKPYLIPKAWSNLLNENKCIQLPSSSIYDADLISTSTYVTFNGKEVPFEVGHVSFDIDFKYTSTEYTARFRCAPHIYKCLVMPKLIRKAIKLHYPELRPKITFMVSSRNDGICLLFSFPSFRISDQKLSRIALEVQERIGHMLLAIGIGVDKAAYGLLRDVPNFLKIYTPKKPRTYRNKMKGHAWKDISKKGKDGKAIRNILTELLDITQKYKPIWNQGKKANPDKFLYKIETIEMTLAKLHSDGFQSQEFRSQDAAAKFLGLSIKTFRNWLRGEAPACLSIEQLDPGYRLSLSLNEMHQKRAKQLLKGEMHKWVLPYAHDVLDGERNTYIWRCAVTLKMNGFGLFAALDIMHELVKKIPGHQLSINCRRVATLVRCIYKTRPYVPGRYKNLKPIPELGEILLALERNPRNGVEERSSYINKEQNKKAKFIPQLSDLIPSNYTARDILKDDGSIRVVENLLDASQRLIQKQIYQGILKPLLEPLFGKECFAYREGLSFKDFNERRKELLIQNGFELELDVEKFYPSINQDILKQKMIFELGEDIALPIFAAVTADRIYNGKLEKRTKGIVQGSSFSNILGNFYLLELDQWLEAKNIPFCRYGDNTVIFAESQEAIHRLYETIREFVFAKLNLNIRINEKE